MANKVNYTGSSKVIKRLCEAVNALIDGGGGGTTVTVTPYYNSGIKIATITVNGVDADLYIPSEVIVAVTTKVSGGYNGGAVISILFDDIEKFNAIGNSPYNLLYDNTHTTFSYADHTYEITIIPPSSNTGTLGIEITDGSNTINYNVPHLGNNTSYGYNFEQTDNTTFKYT